MRQLADLASKSVNINNSELSIGSKRNLTGQMIALESNAKRIKETDKDTNKTRGLGRRPRGSGGGGRGRRGRKKQPSLTPPLLKQPVNDISDLCKIPQSPDANYNQLLYMAGLEVIESIHSSYYHQCHVYCRHLIQLLDMLIIISLK